MATGAFLVLSAASIALQAVSTSQASEAAKAKAEQQQAVGREEAKRQRIAGRRLAGTQRVNFAKSGVEISSGTPLEILGQTAADAELNALRAQFGFDASASDIRAAGDQRTLQGIAGIADTAIGAGFQLNSLRQGGTSGRTLIGQNNPTRDAFPQISAPPGGPGRGGRFPG